MQTDTTRILGDWATLSDQLDRAGTISGWVAAEPVFTELHSVAQLHGWWQRGESDAMIGALVRLAAADGGDDLDAATVLLHLLEPGARNLARRLARNRDDALGVVLGELACQSASTPGGVGAEGSRPDYCSIPNTCCGEANCAPAARCCTTRSHRRSPPSNPSRIRNRN